MPDFNALANTAKSLVEDSGRSVTIIRLARTVSDSAKPWRAASDTRTTPDDSVTATAVFVAPVGEIRLGRSTSNQENARREMQTAIVALGSASTDDLATFDELIDGADRWKIESVESLNPATPNLLYYLQLRR